MSDQQEWTINEIRDQLKSKLSGNWLMVKDELRRLPGDVQVFAVERIRGTKVKKCKRCGQSFSGRNGAKWCSGRCRAADWRSERRKNVETGSETPRKA